MNTKYHMILGSSSPRRKQLMEGLGLPFDTATIHGIDEDNLPKDIEPADIPLHLAQTKSYAYQKPLQGNDLINPEKYTCPCSDRSKDPWKVAFKIIS